MTNKEKIEAIKKWQECDFVHPLTCGKDICDGILLPVEDKIVGDIILICPICDYSQVYVPEMIYHFDYSQFDKIKEITEWAKKKQKEDEELEKACGEGLTTLLKLKEGAKGCELDSINSILNEIYTPKNK